MAPWEAASGAKIPVCTPTGEVTLTIPPGTTGGQRLRIRGQGLARAGGRGGRGDFVVRVMITLPENLTHEQLDLLRQLEESASPPIAGGARAPAT